MVGNLPFCTRCSRVGRLHLLEQENENSEITYRTLCDDCWEEITGLTATCQDYCELPMDHDGLCTWSTY
jgi:hypothetical protein